MYNILHAPVSERKENGNIYQDFCTHTPIASLVPTGIRPPGRSWELRLHYTCLEVGGARHDVLSSAFASSAFPFFWIIFFSFFSLPQARRSGAAAMGASSARSGDLEKLPACSTLAGSNFGSLQTGSSFPSFSRGFPSLAQVQR